MRVDASITGGSRQVLVLTVRDVEMGFRVTVLLGQTEVNHVDLVPTFSDAHQEIVGLNVTMDKGLGMNVFNAGDELIGQQKHRLQGKLAVAKVEQILQAGSKKIQDHGIVITFGPKPAHKWNANPSSKRLVDTGLIFKLRMLRFDALQLDGDLFARDDIGAYRVRLACSTSRPEFPHRGKYHRSCHFQSYGQYGIYCPRGDPRRELSANDFQQDEVVNEVETRSECNHLVGWWWNDRARIDIRIFRLQPWCMPQAWE